VASSLSNFLRNNNFLYELQSTFRSGHSTETALIRLTDQILEKGKTTSEQLTVKQGVSQGPVLFILFVNDMPIHVQNSAVDSFADDTTLASKFKLENHTITKSNIVTGPE